MFLRPDWWRSDRTRKRPSIWPNPGAVVCVSVSSCRGVVVVVTALGPSSFLKQHVSVHVSWFGLRMFLALLMFRVVYAHYLHRNSNFAFYKMFARRKQHFEYIFFQSGAFIIST